MENGRINGETNLSDKSEIKTDVRGNGYTESKRRAGFF